MATMTKVQFQVALRLDFASFVERSFYELNPQTNYQPNWHIEVIAEALERCRTGKLRRLIINVPPTIAQVAHGLDCISRLSARTRTFLSDHLRQLCAGPRRQTGRRLSLVDPLSNFYRELFHEPALPLSELH